MAYLVRRLLENTSNDAWLMHRHEEADPDEVLARPAPVASKLQSRPRFANHPPAEFHRPEHREAMQAAIDAARRSFGQTVSAVVAGPARPRPVNEVRPPSEPETAMAYVDRCNESDVRDAVAAAKSALPAWRDLASNERAAILRRAADRLADRRWELAAIEVFECAKPWAEADGDVCEAIDFLRYYALQAEDLGRGLELSPVPGERNHLAYEARGVAAVIGPWNFPLAIPCGMTAGALAAGCTVVLKPAEQSPVVASRLVEVLHESGVPTSALQFVPGPGEVVGRALVEHPDTAVIAFTGSNAVGLEILRGAAEVRPGQGHLKQVIAELGGKNAIVVDDDADLDVAVAETVRSGFAYAGQKCSAGSRVYVVAGAFAEFRSRLAAAVDGLVVGPPDDPFTFVPPVISLEAKERIERYGEAAAAGGTLVAEAALRGDPGWYVAPKVFEGVPRDSSVACEEVFGPLLLIDAVATFEEGLDRALDTDFALTGGVFSRNPRNIARATERFRVGNLYINRSITGSLVGRQPFGGFALSGTGHRAGGPGYVEAFTVSRVVTENTMRRGFAPED
jgi:RHH-type proline utilization regulon transcriptional repressor/proline dehydrogenase/delta 1-pyrroline-5-carboxylate dehydrogenase